MNKLWKRLLISFGVCSMLVMGGCQNQEEEPQQIQLEPNNVYDVPKNPTQEMADVYNELSKALQEHASADQIAALAAVNFSYDFFTLLNKENKEDVGGMTYIPESMKEAFQKFAVSYFYENYDTIINLYDKESLPYVIMHEVGTITPESVLFEDLTYDGYRVSLTLKYKDSAISADALKTKLEVLMFQQDGVFRLKAVQ